MSQQTQIVNSGEKPPDNILKRRAQLKIDKKYRTVSDDMKNGSIKCDLLVCERVSNFYCSGSSLKLVLNATYISPPQKGDCRHSIIYLDEAGLIYLVWWNKKQQNICLML